MDDTMVVDVSQDWVTACDVQQRFMHHTVPAAEGISYSGRCRQLRALGGDCYDFLPLPQGRLGFAVGDASGKSLPAALMIANVQSSLRTAAFFAGDEPRAVLAAVNFQLHTASLADRFATLFYGVFDPATRTLRYANAGHNPPMVVRRNGSLEWLDTAGLPLGLFADTTYEEGLVRLEPGDKLVAYTDGLIEVTNPAGYEWGVQGIANAAAQSRSQRAEEVVDELFASFDQFSQGREADDATVVVVVAT